MSIEYRNNQAARKMRLKMSNIQLKWKYDGYGKIKKKIPRKKKEVPIPFEKRTFFENSNQQQL